MSRGVRSDRGNSAHVWDREVPWSTLLLPYANTCSHIQETRTAHSGSVLVLLGTEKCPRPASVLMAPGRGCLE